MILLRKMKDSGILHKKKIIRMVAVVLTLSLLITPIEWVNASEKVEMPQIATAGDMSEDEIIVVYNDAGASDSKSEKIQQEAEQALAENDIEVVEEVSESNEEQGTIVSAEIPKDMTVEEAIEQAMEESSVSYAQPNYKYSLLEKDAVSAKATTNDPNYVIGADGNKYNAYYLDSTNTKKAWDLTKCKKQVTVATFDTGCRLNHEDLSDNILKKYAYDAYYGVKLTSGSVPNGGDPNGHGTHVAGLIAAQANNAKGFSGTSYNANILPVKIFDDTGETASTDDAIRGIEYCEELIDSGKVKNLHVINMSIGYYGIEDQLLKEAIERMTKKYKVLFVCAGGNGDGVSTPRTASLYPSDMAACLSVTSLTKDGDNSSWSDYNSAKDISAPGEWIPSTYCGANNSYAVMSGSSMAAPIVAGICALLWSVDPDLTPAEAIKVIKKTADPVASSKNDGRAGKSGSAGAVNAQKAVNYLIKHTIKKAKITGVSSSYTYKGKAIKPAPTVKLSGVELKKGKDYTVSYTNNAKVGTATITVKGAGNYTGTVKKTFNINPKGTSISKLTKQSKGFTVKWKKQKTQTTGYQIQYSRYKNFEKSKKTVTIKKVKTVKKKVSKLKKKKKYYVRIRTYKTVGGKKYYSSWSKVKKVKTK